MEKETQEEEKEDINKEDKEDIVEPKKDEENKEVTKLERSILSLKGGKQPFSIYTRRVINIDNIKSYLSEDSTHGVCGGHNLGNTCFMNSSIACLSNCTELTCYFLSGDYLKDINRENKLGMGGLLAESWGDLLQEYWVQHTRVGDPSDFKKIFGSKIKRFSGFSQQDSNEFIDLFLDILNEDLKSENKNNYIELKEKGENETDEECSKRFWKYYLERNDSIITDLFCGQLKCTITCPKCGLVNITFDPFYTLNLNIPEKKSKNHYYNEYLSEFQLFYIPKYWLRTPIRVVFNDILKKATFKDCFRCLKTHEEFKYHKVINKLIINKISQKESIEFIKEEDSLTVEDYNEGFYFCYDIMDENDNINIPIYFSDNKGLSEFPRVIMVSGENSNLDDFRKKIYFNVRKIILSPLKKESEEIDDLSNEIKNYTKNIEIKDEYIFELINKEYQEVFNNNENSNNDDNDNNQNIKNFIKDLPFKIYLTKNIKDKDEDHIYIIDEKNFLNLSQEFSDLTNIESYNDSIKNLLNILKDYQIVVEFKNNSKYINKSLYKLNTCVKCTCDYYEEEENNENNGKITLKKCFDLFSKEEKLKEGDEWYCSNCKKHVLANKKMELYYTPKIFVICFKRFIRSSFSWERNDEIIYFPISDLDMKEFLIGPDKEHSKYDLFAVSQHYGGTGFGHYTAICKNFNKWYSYNDSSVHETNPENALESSAYVVFYRRQTD